MLSGQKLLGSKKDRRLDETAEILEKAEILQTPRVAGICKYKKNTFIFVNRRGCSPKAPPSGGRYDTS